ncbi:TPA: ammonium transporter [Acinetobacter baumannii]|jgi:Amt family ammonium transporter|uniref:Ammonium transporter n=22 Tax=Acinetobacter baumannii TaxID=470 RepID=V5VHK6_ACIBA|nr:MULTISPECIES: ammonium transporter [Acinetobacter]ADX90711.1 ammonia permease [Acinetobacter baumannii TCDC-AB0715]AHX28998.1 ammonia channel protein [Acinetobacter baumannii AC12]AHX66557.1 ammonia channel protein [Acinetobacter baumannii AC30]EMT84781.1 ammonium transporter [Acinetobacter baumannii ABNIH5]ETY67923.1 ammonia channel protein [Acinetobacter baumannii MDR_MMC4]EXB53072.1 ammonium transporter family protein [Acinetobacter baumannii 1440422]EXC93986.1 ammonium transporter fam
MKKMLMALSLTGALLGGTAAWAEETVTTPTSEVTATSTSEAPATIAAAPAAEETPAAPTPTAKLDTGDTSWILISTALVLLMTIPGLALFYGGMVRKKNVLSTMMFSLSAAILVSLLWVIAGYSIAFSGTGAYFGDLSKAMLNGVAFDALSGTIPESLFVIFQMTFAIITVAILSGSIADRMKYSAFMAFIAIWVLVVYAPITHWVWAADGWLFKAGALDFAGGTVVHINSGVAGLVAAYMLGKRIGLGRESMAPHNLTLTVIGASLLWVGWFGFNGGSALGAGARASMAILVTQVAAAAAAFSWLVVERMIRGKASVLGGASGAVAGLVVITPAAGFVGVGGALVMGLIGGVVCFWGITALKRLLKADDALDAFGLHAVGGIVGAILTGVFYSDEIIKAANVALAPTFAGQLWVQVEGVLATMVYSGIATFIILKVIDLIIGLRVNSDDERMGLDLSQHGERIE